MNLAKTHNEDINLDLYNFTGDAPRVALIKPMELIRIQLKDILRQHTDKHKILNDYTIKAINDFTDATDVIDPDLVEVIRSCNVPISDASVGW